MYIHTAQIKTLLTFTNNGLTQRVSLFSASETKYASTTVNYLIVILNFFFYKKDCFDICPECSVFNDKDLSLRSLVSFTVKGRIYVTS